MKGRPNLAALYVFWAIALLIPEATMAAQCPAEQLTAGANLGNGLFACHRDFVRIPRRDPNGEQHAACLAASQSQFIAQYDQATASLSDCVLKVRGQAVNRMWTSLFDTIANPLLDAWRQDVNVPLQNGRFSPASRNRRFSTIDKVLGLGLRRALRVESDFVRANELDEASKNNQRSKLARILQRKLRNLTVKRPDYNGPNSAQLTVLANATVSEIVRLALTPSELSLTVPEATGGLNGREVDDGTQVLVSLPTPFVKETDQVAVTWGNQAPVNISVATNDIAAGLATVNIPANVILAAGGGEIDVTATLTDLGGSILAVSSPAVKVTVNTAPRFTSTPPANATQGALYTYAITAADSDPGATLALTAPTLPAWLTLTPTGNGTATLSGTPGSTDVGTHNVVLQVSDGTNSVEQSFTIAVDNVNDAPDFTIGPNQTVLEDAGPQTINAWATGIVAGPPNETGQTLTFQVTGNTNPALFTAAPAVAPDGRLTYTPAPNANGSATITLELKDNGGTANGGQDTSAPQSFTITINPGNDPPVITSNGGGAASLTVAENATTVTTVTSTDIDGGPPVYSIAGGADAARFAINGSTGALTFATPPDFEAPTDAGADNIYEVVVQVSDGNGGIATQTIGVNVTNLDEPPVITSNGGGDTASIPVPENTGLVTTITATDLDLPPQTLTYSIVGGADAALFFINPDTRELSIDVCGDGCEPDFENPRDAGGNNVYDVIVQVSDGNGGTDRQDISVAVTNVNEPAVASNDTYSLDVCQETTLNVNAPGVLANDSDPDASDVIAAVLETNVESGTLNLNTDGSFTYTPGDFIGVASFTYNVRDKGGLDSFPATVTINVTDASCPT